MCNLYVQLCKMCGTPMSDSTKTVCKICAFKKKLRQKIRRLSNRYITLYFFFDETSKHLRKDDLFGISPGITYYLIMGFIPFLIFAVNVILFSTVADIDFVINKVHTYCPPQIADTLETDIQRIVKQRSDLWLWVSLLFAAYSFEQALALLVRATDDLAYGDDIKQTYPDEKKKILYNQTICFIVS